MEDVRNPDDQIPSNPDELQSALLREMRERRNAQSLAKIQADAVQLTLDILAREPDRVESFFESFTKTLVEECKSLACDVWLTDDDERRVELWVSQQAGRFYTSESREWDAVVRQREGVASHLFEYIPGWRSAIVYERDDPRLPAPMRDSIRRVGVQVVHTAPLALGGRNLGWIVLVSRDTESAQWQVAMVEAIARQATLLLDICRLAERKRAEDSRKAALEERNRLAREIHDNLAQGFAAILMQLQAARREMDSLPEILRTSVENAVVLARTHLGEARRSVCALRPRVGDGEDVPTALRRLADLGQRTSSVPIELVVDELPRIGDGIEREIVAIAQEALTNAVRHADARRIRIQASTVNAIGLRVSVADDGRGIPRGCQAAGFGMTSMQERADRIGASLTIVTAPRSGTEVVLAWEPSGLPTQVHFVC